MVHVPHSRELVLRVNELFHDLEGEGYDRVHPEIFTDEKQRWDRYVSRHIGYTSRPRTFVDLGAGTGFVGERLLPSMVSGDVFICADISSKKLEICLEKFFQLRPDIRVQTLKTTDEKIHLPDASVDVVTMNSVLHHVPDAKYFLMECARILKPGGFLCIGHEPNNRFFRNNIFLQTQASLFHYLIPRRIVFKFLQALGFYKSTVVASSDPILEKINETLIAERLIHHPLSPSDLSMLIDVHSPTAGGQRRNEGFDPCTILDDIGSLKLRSLETYNHLSKISGRYSLLRYYEAFLGRIFPCDGATFFIVAQKNLDL